jgi:hypothetical protein
MNTDERDMKDAKDSRDPNIQRPMGMLGILTVIGFLEKVAANLWPNLGLDFSHRRDRSAGLGPAAP